MTWTQLNRRGQADRIRELLRMPPAPEVRPRLDKRGAVVVLLVAVLGLSLGGAVLWRARPHTTTVVPGRAVPTRVEAAPILADLAAPVPTHEPNVVVDVQGKVRRPGTVVLPPGSRVEDALNAAGGARPGVGTETVNLAQPLSDGEQIVLGEPGAVPASGATGGPARPAGPLNLNTATVQDFDALPGIGPVMAQRIIDFRQEHGRFSTVEELQEVPGIGPAKFASLKSKVRV